MEWWISGRAMIDALAATSFDDGFNKPADKPAFVAAREVFAGNKQVDGKKRADRDGRTRARDGSSESR